MKNKIINFIKGHSLVGAWTLLYLIAQVIASMGIMVLKVFNDENYADLFLKTMKPIYSDGSSQILYTEEMLGAYSVMLSEIMLPILLVSNLIIVLFFVIKNYFSKEKALKKLKINNISKYIFIGILLNIVISLIISFLPKELLEQHSLFTSVALNGGFIMTLITTGIISPIAEEVIFRYGIQRSLYRVNPIYAIIYQSVIFGLLHGNIIQITYATVLGLIFGYIYYRSKNLLTPILLHIAINSSSVIISSTKINEFFGLLLLVIISFIMFIVSEKLLKKKKIVLLDTTENKKN